MPLKVMVADGVIDSYKYTVCVVVVNERRKLNVGSPPGATVVLVAAIVVPLAAVDAGSCSVPL